MCIVGRFNDHVKDMKTWSQEYEAAKELYAQAIRLQCAGECGLVMTTDDFIGSVRDGSFNDYDGSGQFADYDGNKHEYVHCNVSWLKKHGADYPFVFWYNK